MWQHKIKIRVSVDNRVGAKCTNESLVRCVFRPRSRAHDAGLESRACEIYMMFADALRTDFPWFDDGAWECGCGAKRCRGRLRPTDWMRLCDEQWYPDDAFAPYLKEKLKGRRQQVAAATQNKAIKEDAAAKLVAKMAAAEDVAIEMSNTA